jgi:hypothetical protein
MGKRVMEGLFITAIGGLIGMWLYYSVVRREPQTEARPSVHTEGAVSSAQPHPDQPSSSGGQTAVRDSPSQETISSAQPRLDKPRNLDGQTEAAVKDSTPAEQINTGSAAKSMALPAPQKIYAGSYLLEVQYCNRTGTRVICHLLVTNTGDDGVFHLHGHGGQIPSRMFDTDGGEYIATSVRLGTNVYTGWAGNILINGVPMSATLTFEKVPQEKKIFVLVIGCWDHHRNYSLKVQPVREE